MKVCILTSVHPCFDVRIFEKQARSLSLAGYETTLVGIADFDETTIDGIRILGLPQPSARVLRPVNWWRILRIALRERADLYHFHDPELLIVGGLLKVLTGKPVVYDVHENYPEDILTKEWIPGPLRRIVSLLFRAFEDNAARFVDGLVVVNERLAQRFAGKSRVAVVSNYSRLDRFLAAPNTKQPNESPSTPYFVYAGRVSDDRGLYECLRAVQSLGEEEVELRCAGRLGAVTNEDLRAALDNRRTESRFQYLGLLPYEEIPGLFRGARAGLLCFWPTPNNVLGTPNKLFEYMSAGIPVIASDFPFIREVVEHAECGFLVQPGNVEGIAAAMQQLLSEPEEAARLGGNGLQAVKERYNWQMEERKLLSLYASLLGAGSNKDSRQELPGAELGGPVGVREPTSQEVDVAESDVGPSLVDG